MAFTDPVPRLREYVAERFQRNGCGDWPAARIPANRGFANGGVWTAVKDGARATDHPNYLEQPWQAGTDDIRGHACARSR